MLQKYRSDHIIVGASGVACSMSHTENPQILGAIVQNLVAQATWHPVFVHLLSDG
jgi:hypothetical protein